MLRTSATTGPVASVAGGFGAANSAIDYGRGTANTGAHGERTFGAVFGAGATLHASVAIVNSRTFVDHNEYCVRAHFKTPAAPVALAFVQLQRDYIR
jgi:hypothetical protein